MTRKTNRTVVPFRRKPRRFDPSGCINAGYSHKSPDNRRKCLPSPSYPQIKNCLFYARKIGMAERVGFGLS